MYWRFLFVVLLLTGSASLAGAQTPPPASNVYVFPALADGVTNGSTFRSSIRVYKTSTPNPMQCTLVQRNTSAVFTGVLGYVYPADVTDAGFSPAAQTLVTLDQYLPFEILRSPGQSPFKTGYAKLTCPGTAQAQLQIAQYDAQNKKLSEVNIVPATQGKSFQFLVDRRDGTRLGFSLVNDSVAEEQFVVIARDQFNYEIDRFYDIVEPFSQVSRFADEMVRTPANFVGSIEIVGLGDGPQYLVGTQFTGTVFTTIQPIVRAAALP